MKCFVVDSKKRDKVKGALALNTSDFSTNFYGENGFGDNPGKTVVYCKFCVKKCYWTSEEVKHSYGVSLLKVIGNF